MARRMTKTEKAIEVNIEAAFRVHGHRVPINMMDLGKVFDAGRAAARAGTSVNDAVKAAVAQYRQN